MESLAPEYRVITQCYPNLCFCIQQSPTDVVTQLKPYGLLAPEDWTFITSAQNNDKKAMRIVDVVLNQTQLDSQVFHSFVSALEAAGSWTSPIVHQLKHELAQKTREKLAKHISPPKSLLPDLSTAVSRVRDTEQEVQAKGKLVEKQVNAKFQEVHDILEQCKARVLRKSKDIIERKIENLSAQEKGLEKSVEGVQRLVDFVECKLENASDEELITMQDQIMSRIEQDAEVVRRGKEAASADPVENVDFGVKMYFSEDVEKLCESNVSVFDGRVDPLKCTVEGDATSFAEVNVSSSFILNTNQPDCALKSEVILASLVDQTSPTEAVPVKRGLYSIEYTPKVRGRHHLQISVDGQPIPGSPFSVYVRNPPTKLDKPARVIGYVTESRYVAFNSAEEMIVTRCKKDALILNKKGEKLHTICKSKHNFGNVRGVALDKDDNIYVSDSDNHCVYKLDKYGNQLKKKFGKKGRGREEFNWPRGVAVAGDRVLVCDRRNNRVQVLTTELEPVRSFGSQGTGHGEFREPEDIAVDSEGMLYVSDHCNNRIQVFTGDGQFVDSIGKQGMLQKPEGVCVDANFVYAVELDSKRVCVFTKDDQFKASFCESQISEAHGVSVDSDGFVYLCSPECILVF